MELTIWSSGFCLWLCFRNTFKVNKQQQQYQFSLFLTPPLTQAQMCKGSVSIGLKVSIYKKLLEFLMCTQSWESLIKRRHWIHVVTSWWWPVTIKSTCVTIGVWNIMDKHLFRCFRIYRVKVAGLKIIFIGVFILRVTSSYKSHLIIAWLKRSGVRQLDSDNVQVFSENSLI